RSASRWCGTRRRSRRRSRTSSPTRRGPGCRRRTRCSARRGRRGTRRWWCSPTRPGPAFTRSARPAAPASAARAWRPRAGAPAAGRRVGGLFAVAPDPRETENLESLSDQALDEQLGFQAVHLTAGQGAGAALATDRLTREWTVWLLGAVLLLLLGETALAWF